MDNFNITKFFKDQYLAESSLDDKLRGALGDKDFEKATSKKVPGFADVKPEKKSKFKKTGEKAGFDMRGLKEIIKKTVKEYGGAEFDPVTAKRNAFAASYNSAGDTKRFRNYMEFLSRLKISGKTNMLGATPYLQAEFNLEKKEAKDLLAYWIGSYRNMDEIREFQQPKSFNPDTINLVREMLLVADIQHNELVGGYDEVSSYLDKRTGGTYFKFTDVPICKCQSTKYKS